MPRNPDGTYTLPLPPVLSGQTVEADWANTTLEDLRVGLQDSLSRTAQGSMTNPLKLVDGTKSAPGVAFVNESNTGFYRPDAGDLYVSVLGVDFMRWTDDNGVQISTDGSTWSTVTTAAVLADQEVTAVTWSGNTLTLVKAKGSLTVDIDTMDALTVVNNLTVNGVVYAGQLAIEGPVNQISNEVGGSGTASMTADTSLSNRWRATNNATATLNITRPTGPVTMAGGPVEEYTVEGTILFANGATPGVITLQAGGIGVSAADILGEASITPNVNYLLTYVIHRLTGDVYDQLFIWSAA